MKIVVDSACDYDKELLQKYDFDVAPVPFNLQLDDELYTDDQSLDLYGFIDKMKKSGSVKTSAPSPELFYNCFKGNESIFAVTISKHLSTTYQNAVLAKKMYLEDFGDKFIHVFDSASASGAETVIAMKIAECIKGKMTELQIVEHVNRFIKGMKTFFILENYTNLVRNGRMNAVVAKAASILSIKPICAAVDGKAEMIDKAMGTQKAFKKTISIIAKDAENCKDRILAIAHVRCKKKAELFKNEVLKAVQFKDVVIVETAGLCSTYADDEGIIISY